MPQASVALPASIPACAHASREEVQVPQEASVVTSSTAAGRRAAPSPFLCTWQTGGSGAVWVHVAGGLDPATSPQLAEGLREAQLNAHLVVLDLRELTSIESSGVDVILDAAGGARRYGSQLMLVRGPVQVDRVLTLTGACNQVLIFDLDPTEPARTLLDVA
jgi:anti-anti-sigma factor